jgi:hypothetical protein
VRSRLLSVVSRSIIVVAAATPLVVGLNATAAHAATAGQVSSKPAVGTPHLPTTSNDTQQIRQLVQCGSNMYAVGSFSSIIKGSTTFARNNVVSFLATAPYTVTSWNPNVNGKVDSIAFNGTDCSHAYLGGSFSSVNGTSKSNIAEVDTTTGALIPGFTASANREVETLLGHNGHLLTGGYFTVIDGKSTHAYYASLNPATGADDNYVSLAVSGHYQYTDDGGNPAGGNASRVYNQQLSNGGTRVLLEGDFTQIGGQPRQQVAMIDLGATSVTTDGWDATEFNANCASVEPFYAQAAAWSPDDSTVYVGTTGYKPANGPGYNTRSPRAGLCDAMIAFPSTSSQVTHKWINYAGCDSMFAAAADASTAYFGGHERWASNPFGCDAAGPGAVTAPGMVGLSPANGSVTFNPTRGRGLGADDMLVTSAGLWIASDNFEGTNQCGGVSGYAGICLLPYTTPTAPKAAFTAQCAGLTCTVNGTGSTDPGGTITGYSWNWGDGSAPTQDTTGTDSHNYASGGSFTVTLTVTDNNGATNNTAQTVNPSAVAANPITFGGSATYDGNASTATVTVPQAAHAGDALLLFESYASTSDTATAPAGWTPVGTTGKSNLTSAVFTRTATATDPGSTVSITFSASVKASLTVADYAHASATVEAAASATAVSTTNHTTPTVTGLSAGSLAVSFWTDKSTTTSTWTTPSDVTKRADAYGTLGGAVSALLGDSGSAVAGSYGGKTATTNATSGSAAQWTIGLSND